MSINRYTLLFLAIFCLVAYCSPIMGSVKAETGDGDTILLLYQQEVSSSEVSRWSVRLKHYAAKVVEREITNLSRYKAPDSYVAVVMLMDTYDPSLISVVRERDAKASASPMIVIGQVGPSKPLPVTDLEYEDQASYTDTRISPIVLDDSMTALAWASNKDVDYVFASRSSQGRSLWMIGMTEHNRQVEVITMSILSEALSSIGYKEALLLVDGIHARTSVEQLASLVDRLEAHNVNYGIVVAPLTDFEGESEWLTHNEDLIKALSRYTSDTSLGRIVVKGTPGANLDQELAVLSSAGLYPTAYMMPSQGLSAKEHAAVEASFSTLIGDISIQAETGAEQLRLFYRLGDGMGAYSRLPAALMFDDTNPQHELNLREAFTSVRPFTEAFHTIAVKVEVSSKAFERLLVLLGKQGLDYHDLAQGDYHVRTPFMSILNGHVEVKDAALQSALAEEAREARGLDRFSLLLSWGIAGIVIFFLLMFVLFIFYMRRQRKVRLFEEEDVDER